MDYSNGKIYALRSPNTDNFFIGSTCQPLDEQMHKIRQELEIVFHDRCDNYIELVEDYPCENKSQLRNRQEELIQQSADKCKSIAEIYKNSKIYKITSLSTGKYYMGITCLRELDLHKIISENRSYFKTTWINKEGEKFKTGYINVLTEVFENYPCMSINQLRRRLNELIEQSGENCVNKLTVGQTTKELIEAIF